MSLVPKSYRIFETLWQELPSDFNKGYILRQILPLVLFAIAVWRHNLALGRPLLSLWGCSVVLAGCKTMLPYGAEPFHFLAQWKRNG